jgi:hypothetical protein
LKELPENQFLHMLLYCYETWGGIYVGAEECECGTIHIVYAPLARVIHPCDKCGLPLDMFLEDRDA